MKKGILILLGMFMMVSTVEAKNGKELPNRFRVNYYSYNNSVNFIERGVEFFIFTNGDFDFDDRFNNRSLRINRDFNGRIRSIGNVFINYDRAGNVTRIGDVFIRYNRNRLTRVGDLRVNYNRWGYPVFYGNVRDFYYDNGIRFNISFGDVFNYNDNFFSRNDFRRNYSQFREDRNFFYYKARPNANIGKRSNIIKRRKSANEVGTSNNIKRDNNNSYRNSNRSNTVKRSSNTTYRKPIRNGEVDRNTRTKNKKQDLNKRVSKKTIDKKEKRTERKRRD